MTFDEQGERLMLVDTLRYGLHITDHLDQETHLGPEDRKLQRWRVRAQAALQRAGAARP